MQPSANNILFSIIIPVYNREQLIGTTLKSVLSQAYKTFEVLIIDDGSTDNTHQVIASFEDPRVKYFYKQNEERAIARNFGITRAKGHYVTFLDSDDLLYENFLSEAYQLIRKHNTPEWFHLAYEVKDEKGKTLWKETNRNTNTFTLTKGNVLSCIGVFIRHDIIRKNLFDEAPQLIGSEDYELWLRLYHQYPIYLGNTVVACMYQHAERSVGQFKSNKLISRVECLIEKRSKYFQEREKRTFYSHRYLYLALHLAMIDDKPNSLKYAFKALNKNFKVCFTRKFLVVLLILLKLKK